MAYVIAPPTPIMKGVSMVCGENASDKVKAVGSVIRAVKNCQKFANDCGKTKRCSGGDVKGCGGGG